MDARGDSKTSYYLDNLLFEKKQKYYLLLSCVPMVASGKAERFGAKKEAKKHPPNPSPSLYGRDVTENRGNRRFPGFW